MSRAFCVNLSTAEVVALCAKRDAAISVVEPLQSGGTRVVLKNSDDAAMMGRVFAGKLLSGLIVRTPLRVR
jgi:hypothetical protein